MKEKQLITFEKKPKSIPESTVYLTLLAEEMNSHRKSQYQGEYTFVPVKLTNKYLEFKGSYWKVLESCLRNFEDVKRSEFTDDYREVAIELLEEDLVSVVDDMLSYISNKIHDKSDKMYFHTDENAHSHLLVRELLNKKKLTEEKSSSKKEDTKIISLLKLPESTLVEFERKLRMVAHAGLMKEALKFAVRRAKLNGDRYRFKKLMHSLSDIYDDYIINSGTNKPKKSIIEKEDSELVKHITSNYEVIGNNIYLLNKRKYDKAVRAHFIPKLKKARE